jgi:hypothetical protein
MTRCDYCHAKAGEPHACNCWAPNTSDAIEGLIEEMKQLRIEEHNKIAACFTVPDTPQSVPACTCSKHPLWDGYDGDCPIHGWFEPATPDAPLSQTTTAIQ